MRNVFEPLLAGGSVAMFPREISKMKHLRMAVIAIKEIFIGFLYTC